MFYSKRAMSSDERVPGLPVVVWEGPAPKPVHPVDRPCQARRMERFKAWLLANEEAHPGMIDAATGTINYDELLLKPAVFEVFVLLEEMLVRKRKRTRRERRERIPVLAYSP